MPAILNIAAYLFVELRDTAGLRQHVHDLAASAGLKGTVLLAKEGINLFLAGEATALRGFVADLRQDERLAALTPKESWSDHIPFRKLLVKCKREIIRMNHPAIRPEAGRGGGGPPPTLARWLDAGRDDGGRPLLMLDTRNGFEVAQGRFRGALDFQLGKFSDFPDAALARRQAFAGKTVVSYCTGGIRCEKAAIFLAEAGVERVVQLDGGILGYFEQVGDRHFEGECFVFDQRIAVDAALGSEAGG